MHLGFLEHFELIYLLKQKLSKSHGYVYVPWVLFFLSFISVSELRFVAIIKNDTVMYWSDDFFYERNFEMLSIFFYS